MVCRMIGKERVRLAPRCRYEFEILSVESPIATFKDIVLDELARTECRKTCQRQYMPPSHQRRSVDTADTRVGRPLTPMSVAGVNRRVHRPCGVAVTAEAVSGTHVLIEKSHFY